MFANLPLSIRTFSILFFTLCSLSLNLKAYAQATQTLGSLEVDRLGAAVYTLPISAPNGVGGVKPNITALYNSQAANGLLGKGGSIGGLAEAKSSVNGADKAAPPVGSPTARLNQWMNDYRAGKYDNADPATLNKFRELQQIYESSGATPSIKGVWVQVEVPKFNSSNFTGVETIVSAWN